eukprot:1191750-Prorocentrum_minimum.AAC.1
MRSGVFDRASLKTAPVSATEREGVLGGSEHPTSTRRSRVRCALKLHKARYLNQSNERVKYIVHTLRVRV